MNEVERKRVGSEMASTVQDMETRMDEMLSEFDQMNEAIDNMLSKSDTVVQWKEEDEVMPNGIFDTGATSGAAAEKDAKYLINTGEMSDKIFIIPNSEAMPASAKMKLSHQLRHPATEMNVVPGMHTSLISGCKFADADYVTVLDKNELNIYDGRTTTITISEKAVLKGYRDKQSGLWRIPLKENVANENTDTLLIQRPMPNEAISHVFELPSTEKNHRLLPCGCRFSNERNMDHSSPCWKLQHMADAHCKSYPKILPRN